jgi:hypothetical protein
VPLNYAATLAVKRGTLAARGGSPLAPQVIVQRVVPGNDVVPVAAHVGATSEGRWSGRGGGQEGHGAGESGECELHLG